MADEPQNTEDKAPVMKHVVIFMRGGPANFSVQESEVKRFLQALRASWAQKHGCFEIVLPLTNEHLWLDTDQVDGWMVKDFGPNMAQIIVAAVGEAQKPPRVPGDEWKDG